MAKQHLINQFEWWLIWDDYLWSEAGFVYSENLTYRREYNWLTASTKLNNAWTTEWGVNWIIEVFSWLSKVIAFFWDDWKIYDNTWVLKYTASHWIDYNNAITYRDYVYFSYQDWAVTKLDRILKTDITAWWWSINENAISWLSDSWTSTMLSYVDEFILIWCWNKLIKITEDNTVWEEIFANSFNADIVWITEYSWLFKIYLENWKIMFWDWQSETFNAITDIHNTIRSVYWHWKEDYIIAWYNWAYTEFFILQWYEPQLIQRVRHSKSLNKSIFALWWSKAIQNPMCKRMWLLYIISNWFAPEWLYTFWTNLSWVPNSFNLDYTHDWDNNNIIGIKAVFPTTSWIYVAYSTISGSNIWFINLNFSWEWNQTEWYWISKVMDFSNRTENKQVKKVIVKTDRVNADNTIKVYVNLNNWGFQPVLTCDDSNQDNWRYTYSNSLWEFNNIQFKVELKWDAKLEEIRLEYDTIEE